MPAMPRPSRLLRVDTGRTVSPWNEPVGKLRVLGQPLAERQAQVAAAAGLRFEGTVDPSARGGDPQALYWDDDVDLTPDALRVFLRKAGPGAQLAVVERPPRKGDLEPEPPGPPHTSKAGVEPTRLIGLRWGGGERPWVLPPLGLSGTGRMAGPFDTPFAWFLSARSATTVHHWSHLLRANVGAAVAEIWAQVFLRPWRPLWAWLRDPLHPRLAAVGRRCKIHPTARLEACVLGDDVSVGAYSVLRGCVLGDGAVVDDHVTARGSVLGPRAHLANYCLFNLGVIGARSSIGHIGAQATVIGDGAFIATFAVLQDLNLSQNIRVPFEGHLVDTGTPFLGCAVGHDVRMGAHVIVSAGRELPNGVVLTADKGVVRRIDPQSPPGAYTEQDGRMVPR